MAVKDDLQWQELSAQLPAGAITIAGGNVTISAGAVTGDAYADGTAAGVVEFLYKLLSACVDAQTTANEALDEAAGDVPLAAFPNFSYGIPDSNGNIDIALTTLVRIPLSDAEVRGQTG